MSGIIGSFGRSAAEGSRARAWRVAATLIALCVLTPGPGHAQQGFDPRQTEKRFDAIQSEQSRADRPAPLPRLDRTAGAADAKPLFVLRGVSVSGAEAIPQGAIRQTYKLYLGTKVSQADLAAIAGAITELYRAAGYHLSRAIVPPQDIQGGRIRIKVIEGSITDIAVKGDDVARFGIAPMLDAVRADRPARLMTLERQLLLINNRPGVRIVDTALEEVGNASGHFRLVVFLKTWRVYTSFGIDNLGSSAVGPWQSYATGAFNSYLAPGDALTLNLSTIPNDPRQLGFGRLSYDMPVGTDGIRIGASALYSEVRPGDLRSQYDDLTRTDSFEVRASFVPLQSQLQTLAFTLAAGFSNSSESDSFGAIYNDRIRTLSLNTDYRLQDDFGGQNSLTLSWRQGLDVFGATQAGDDFASRYGASGQFGVFNLWFTRNQTLSDAWSVKIAAAAQVATTELLTSQQFFLGGAAFGRGYGSAEISGDNGIAGSIELRFDQAVNDLYLKGYQLYAFMDSGAAWNVGFNYTDGLSLTSAGGGVRLFFDGELRADVGVAVPLSYRAPDNENRNPRLLFSLSNSFRMCPERTRMSCS